MREGTHEAIYTFLGDDHPLSAFMVERSAEHTDVMDCSSLTLNPIGVDLKIACGTDGQWVPQRLIRQFSGPQGAAISIWSRKAGGAALWRFPEDPYLPGLADWWREPRDAEGHSLTSPKVLRYVPTRRVTISASRVLNGRAERIIVKFKRRSKIDHASAIHAAVYEAALAQDPTLAIARPLGDIRERNAFCQSFLEGAPFDEAITIETLDDLTRRAGVVHARLHALKVSGVPTWNRASYLDTLAEDVSWVSYMLPKFGQALREEWPRVRDELACSEASREVFCHGDFVPGQMLNEGSLTAVTDFDMARTGPDLQEIAKWLASVKYHVPMISRTLSADLTAGMSLIRRAEARYLDGYAEQTGRRVSLSALRPFIAAAEIHYLGVRLKKGIYSEPCFTVALDRIADRA